MTAADVCRRALGCEWGGVNRGQTRESWAQRRIAAPSARALNMAIHGLSSAHSSLRWRRMNSEGVRMTRSAAEPSCPRST